MGPYDHAGMVIGRFWNLLSINAGNSGVPGISFLGSQGNPLSRMTLVFGENEEASPWEPFHVTKGFNYEDSTFSFFSGRTFTHLLDLREDSWEIHLAAMFEGFTTSLAATIWLEPQVAWTMNDKYGFKDQDQIAQWVYDNCLIPWEVYWDLQYVINYMYPRYTTGEQIFVDKWNAGPGSIINRFPSPSAINTVVVGGSTNAYFMASDFSYSRTVSIDEWR